MSWQQNFNRKTHVSNLSDLSTSRIPQSELGESQDNSLVEDLRILDTEASYSQSSYIQGEGMSGYQTGDTLAGQRPAKKVTGPSEARLDPTLFKKKQETQKPSTKTAVMPKYSAKIKTSDKKTESRVGINKTYVKKSDFSRSYLDTSQRSVNKSRGYASRSRKNLVLDEASFNSNTNITISSYNRSKSPYNTSYRKTPSVYSSRPKSPFAKRPTSPFRPSSRFNKSTRGVSPSLSRISQRSISPFSKRNIQSVGNSYQGNYNRSSYIGKSSRDFQVPTYQPRAAQLPVTFECLKKNDFDVDCFNTEKEINRTMMTKARRSLDMLAELKHKLKALKDDRVNLARSKRDEEMKSDLLGCTQVLRERFNLIC